MPKKRRKKTRRFRLLRLSLVIVIALTIAAIAGYGAYWGYNAVAGRFQIKAIVNDNGEEVEPVELEMLKTRIADVIALKDLSHLKTDIQTYLYNNQLADLKEEINAYLSANHVDPAKIAWSVQDLTTDAYIESDNATTNFTAASTYKLGLTMLWYEKVANGTASLDQTFVFTENMLEEEDDENPDQPIVKKYKVGESIPLSQLLEAAALYSDNVAGHILFENLGGYSAYKNMVTKYTEKIQEKEFSTSNVLNPDFTMDLAYALYNTPDVFDDLKFWLQQAFPYSFLNHNASYGYVQKAGNLEEYRNVIGYMPTEFPYSISIYSSIDSEKGEEIIGDLGTICYNYFLNKYQSGAYDQYDRQAVAEKMYIGSPSYQLYLLPDLPADQRATLENPYGTANSDTSENENSDDASQADPNAQSEASETPDNP